jgi:hypothetical protein
MIEIKRILNILGHAGHGRALITESASSDAGKGRLVFFFGIKPPVYF